MLKTRFSVRFTGALLIMISLAQLQCAPARWQERAANSESSSKTGAADKATRTFETRAIAHQGQDRALDIVWLIDNSTSMNTEAAHVRKNLASFLSTLDSATDLKFALVSRLGTTGTGMQLPAGLGSNFTQVNREVWSSDSLEVASALICPTNISAGSYCEKARQVSKTKDVMTIAGKLTPFLRADSKKAFVFITDDESRMPAATFVDAFTEVYPYQVPVVFGIVGLGTAESPCASGIGTRYAKLAEATGGAVFNVCNKTWEKAFSRLASLMVRAATTPITLPSELVNGARVISVELNGQMISPTHYTISPEGLLFDFRLTRNMRELNVKVVYEAAAAK